jgi:hypothetical protein
MPLNHSPKHIVDQSVYLSMARRRDRTRARVGSVILTSPLVPPLNCASCYLLTLLKSRYTYDMS